MSQRRSDVNEETELWRELHRERQARRANRRGSRTDEILALRARGFDVRPLTDYQFRIDGTLDLFPTNRRYHHLPSQRRGHCLKAIDVAVRFRRSPAEKS